MKETRRKLRLWVAAACALLAGPAYAALQVSDGTPHTGATMGGVNGAVEVTVTDARAIIDWKTLDTDAGELLKFMGEGGYAVLNRVQGGKRTDFMGSLSAPGGHVIIVNPYGIVFGPESIINGAQFTASSLIMDQDAFLNDGEYVFTSHSEIRGEVVNQGNIVTTNGAALLAQRVINKGTIFSGAGTILMATGDKIVLGSEGSNVVVEIEGIATGGSVPDFGDVINEGSLGARNDIILAAGDTFAQSLSVGNIGRVQQSGTIQAGGNLEAASLEEAFFAKGSTTEVAGDISVKSRVSITAEEDVVSGGDMTLKSGGFVKTRKADLHSGGDMRITSGSGGAVSVDGGATSGGDMLLDAGTYISLLEGAVSGGDMTIRTGSDSTFSAGDLIAEGDINLQTDLELSGGRWVEKDGTMIYEAQTVEARTGTLTAEGWIWKRTAGELHLRGGDSELAIDLWDSVFTSGNLYLYGEGDIQIAQELIAVEPDAYMPAPPPGADFVMPEDMGGVSVISREGAIYTRGTDGFNGVIIGYSNDVEGEAPRGGVALPYKDDEGNALGKAAIVLQSRDTLTLGNSATLQATGYYQAADENGAGGVDDRSGIDFLNEDAVTGGFDRNQGVASDVAVYIGSTGGDVVYETRQMFLFEGGPEWLYDPEGVLPADTPLGPATVVLDAWGKVAFGGDYLNYLTNNYPLYEAGQLKGPFFLGSPWRMEVCARGTEWLGQAIAWESLPLAGAPEFMEWVLGADYVLRGAGGENPGGHRAWVLEDQSVPPPQAAPLPHFEDPEVKGCPVELAAAANELGTTGDELQILIGASLAANPNIQACDACAQLLRAVTILKDLDGGHMAAMNAVFELLAPADAPLTPETVASIVVAFAELSQQDADYALASAYVDAFVQYVAAMGELGAAVGDSVTYVMNKHGKALMENANANIAAYVAVQLEQIGG